jgi:protocatechuate 3,4-dioxygenase beta subunit
MKGTGVADEERKKKLGGTRKTNRCGTRSKNAGSIRTLHSPHSTHLQQEQMHNGIEPMAVEHLSPSSLPILPTPSQAEGPFYPTLLPPEQDNDLVQAGMGRAAQGVVTYISGYVLDPLGRPVFNAVVEIWQCDARGLYFHPRHMDRRDSYFQGFGTTVTAANGFYQFRTIRPVPYGNRAPHIHFKVRGTAFDELTTQMYIAGEPRNERDIVLNAITDPAQRARLIVPLSSASQYEPGALTGRFNIVVGDE